MDNTFDLIVIGGGPGGSDCRIVRFDGGAQGSVIGTGAVSPPPNRRVFVPSTVHGIGRLLGITDELKEAGFMIKLGTSFRWGKSPDIWGFRFRDSPAIPEHLTYSYQVSRSKFDCMLLANAERKGVEVRQNHAVKELIEEDGRVTGVTYVDDQGRERTAKAKYVADASGHTTRTARSIGDRVYSKFFQNIALYAYYEAGKRMPPPDDGGTLCAAFDQGWFWYIPLSESMTSVGAVVAREHADAAMKDPERAMEAFVDRCPVIKDYLSPARRITVGEYGQFRIRKDYSYCHSRFWSPGLVLLGDAACFVDPIFSSGVHLATFSALLAARSINTCLENHLSEDVCFEEFERRYRREFSNFYQFNMAFYDIHKDEKSYYWEARSILGTEEASNAAFVRLVSGISPEDFFTARRGLGEVFDGGVPKDPNVFAQFDATKFNVIEFIQGMPLELHQIERQAGLRPHHDETPMFAGGLVPSRDGFHWSQAQAAQVSA